MTRREQILKLLEYNPEFYPIYDDKKDISEGRRIGAQDEWLRNKDVYTLILEENEKLRGALEFYANLESYYVNGKSDLKNHILDDDLEHILYHYSHIELLEHIGGKRARKALESSPLDELLEGEK